MKYFRVSFQYTPPGGGGSTPGGTDGATQFNSSGSLSGDVSVSAGALTAVSTPSAPTVGHVGSSTGTSWKYGIIVLNSVGATAHSTLTTGTGGTNNPDASNYWTITLPTIAGATCAIYRDVNGDDPHSFGTGTLIESVKGLPVTHACDGSTFRDTGYSGLAQFWAVPGDIPAATTVGESASRIAVNQIGFGSSVADDSSCAIGRYASASDIDSVAVGLYSETSGGGASVAIGAASRATATIGASVAVGAGAQATNSSSVAIGYYTTCSGISSISAGEGALASNDYTVAVGNDAAASGASSVAVGRAASATADNATAIGFGASTSTANTVVIGNVSVTDVYFGSTSGAAKVHGLGLGAIRLLASLTASSSASLAFTTRNAAGQSGAIFQSDCDCYLIVLDNILSATGGAGASLTLQFSTDGGSTYDTTSGHYEWGVYATFTGGPAPLVSSSDTAIRIAGTNIGASVAGVNGTVTINNPLSSALHKLVNLGASWYHDGATACAASTGAGRWKVNTAGTAFRLIDPSGNLASGSAYVYGYLKS